ncbi:MAG: hypothetical protein KIS96_03400 [Bauldia sp.]|nr:hypothetical protein [Bauldia sp.]
MTKVVAVLVEDVDAPGTPAGAFEYCEDAGRVTGLLYVCPCGCGAQGFLRFRSAESERPSWIWDGDREKPTLSPSVHHIWKLTQGGTKTHWHGFLRGGVWESV